MPPDDGTVQIRSFRVCFQLERRLHKLGNWRIPLPYGLPLRGIAYVALTLVVVLILRRLPISAQLLGLMPVGIRFGVLPIGVAYALMRLKVDGRPAHAAGIAWARHCLSPSRVCAFQPARHGEQVELGPVTLAPDDRGARSRRAVVEGPARVVLRYPATLDPRGRTLHVRPQPGEPMWRGRQVNLRSGQRLRVR